jgi:hypothetical protein
MTIAVPVSLQSAEPDTCQCITPGLCGPHWASSAFASPYCPGITVATGIWSRYSAPVAFCTSCGGEVKPGGRFCKHCGTPTPSAETGQPAPPAVTPTEMSAATAPVSVIPTAPAPPATAPVDTWSNYASNTPPQYLSSQLKARPLWRNPVTLAVAGVVIIAIVAAVVLLAGSSSSSAQTTASGAIRDLQTGNWSNLCALAEPSERASCNDALRSQTTSASFPKITLASVVVSPSGNQATATITCAGASYCAHFTGANATAQLVKLNGTWYILGDFTAPPTGSGSTGNSGAGTTPTTQNSGNSGSGRRTQNSGNTGNSGFSGDSGNSGFSGNSGNSGFSGNSGNLGVQGNSGSIGNSGNS